MCMFDNRERAFQHIPPPTGRIVLLSSITDWLHALVDLHCAISVSLHFPSCANYAVFHWLLSLTTVINHNLGVVSVRQVSSSAACYPLFRQFMVGDALGIFGGGFCPKLGNSILFIPPSSGTY